jgi:hypothetical protein
MTGMLPKGKPFNVDNHSLFQKYQPNTKWKNISISWQDTMCERKECLAPCIPMRNELPVQRNKVYHCVVTSGENIPVVQNSLIQVKGSSIALEKDRLISEARNSRNLFNIVN